MATGFLSAPRIRLRPRPSGTPTPPPGYKVVNHGNTPIFVKDQLDPLRHAGNIGDDPLDPQKVFSETNPASNKTFMPGDASVNKSANLDSQRGFRHQGLRHRGLQRLQSRLQDHLPHRVVRRHKSAAGYNQAYATKDASADLESCDSAFAPIGASEQNRAAPIDAKTFATYAAPQQGKDFTGPEADVMHRHAKPGEPIDGDLEKLGEIPDRPLSVDEVRALINHGFKPNLSEPAAPASKPLNDPNYQPEPLRIEPTSPDDAPPVAPATGTHKVDVDDTNDPGPSPGHHGRASGGHPAAAE